MSDVDFDMHDCAIMLTYSGPSRECESCDCDTRCEDMALLTVRGKDHDLTASDLRALSDAAANAASLIESRQAARRKGGT